jgi:hypothetical protein
MAECDIIITPEDFFRKVVRTDGAGNYALAVNELSAVGFSPAASCADGLRWEDILALVYNSQKEAINIIDVT